VSFSVAQKTLERLEWAQVLARLQSFVRTPAARARLAPRGEERVAAAVFEASEAGVRARLAETSEAKTLLAAGDPLPLGEIATIEPALARARKGGTLEPRELSLVGHTLATVREVGRFLGVRREDAPLLSEQAEHLTARPELEDAFARCLDPSGEVRDAASPALAAARRSVRELGAEISARLDRILRDPDVADALSDHYFTVRNDRYVLPVRSDARGRVRGIVHDASSSGTTLYVEPEALVEPNNRHKQAEIDVQREIARVLRDLSARVAAVADDLEAELEALAVLDLAFARARLAEEMDATLPEVRREGVVVLHQLRHPQIPAADSVPNDVRLGETYHVLVVSGPNAGGKTVAMKAVALAVLCVRAGLYVAAAPGARVDLFDALLADIGDEQSIGQSLSTFSAHMRNLARIVREADGRSLVALDEIGVGTDPGEGAALAQAVLERLADAGARVMATTHYGLLKEMADTDPRFENASVEFDPETLAPTYRLHIGTPGSSSAAAVAARMGMPSAVLERAQQFLAREDRQLDRMLAELATSRAALEQERRQAEQLREQTEGARDEYRRKIAALQERREKLYRSLRDDLDRSFRDARAQIAAVIRDLQRGGSARDAVRARERLEGIAEAARRSEEQAGLTPEAPEAIAPVDWQSARAGDPVRVAGGGVGVLQALPDKRGRVAVQIGGARLSVPRERVGRAEPAELPKARPPSQPAAPAREPDGEGQDAGRCDLRGLRVDEARDRLLAALDRAMAAGRPELCIVHGIGTGALRKAVRELLASSPYVARSEDAPPDRGGDGATLARLG
jgi:DNA mismatch repair protein MutS2